MLQSDMSPAPSKMKSRTARPKATDNGVAQPSDEDIYLDRVGKRLRKKYPHRYKVIDLFAGAGGMSAGFTHFCGHVFESVWANDFNEDAAKTYRVNFGDHCYSGDIVDILEKGEIRIPQADVVIGGPPCQGFSLLNKFREGDPRKQLWRPFMTIVAKSKAQIFVMENVPQLLGSPEHEAILELAESMGFTTESAILCAADYGVPQTRYRAFIVGCRFMHPKEFFPPRKTHISKEDRQRRLFQDLHNDRLIKNPRLWRTVRDAIGDLEPPVGIEIRDVAPPYDLHFGRTPTKVSEERYRAVPAGGNRFDLHKNRPDITPDCWKRKKSGGTDLFGRLWWDKPSVTIRTEFYKPEKGRYLHPDKHRPITHREAALIQSFPNDFLFTGSKIEVARQIGNAVPPELAARVADSVLALLLRKP